MQEEKKTFDEAEMLEALKIIYKTRNSDALWEWIVTVFNVRIPRKKICKDHDAPFDFICAVFFELYPSIIALANRAGGKTLNFSILDVLNSYLHDNCETATVGAIEEQAKKCYRYFTKWVEKIRLFSNKILQSLQSETNWTNGSIVQILTGTMKGVNSPHPQKAFLDEVELMAWDILQEAFSMAQSKSIYDPAGNKIGEIQGQTIITSTRKFAYGTMERLIKESGQRGFRVFQWCILETVEPHDPEVCALTPFDEDCQGRCREYEGFYSFKDTVANKKKLDKDTWQNQWRCLKPSAKGLVYPQFNPVIHVKRVEPDIHRPLWLAEDFGFAEGHADVVGFFQDSLEGKKRMIGEIWIEGKTDEEILDLVEEKLIALGFIEDKFIRDTREERRNPEIHMHYTSKVQAWYCPPEEPSKISIRKTWGYRVVSQNDPAIRRITYGIPIIRKDLEDDALEIDTSCVMTAEEMGMYPNKKRGDGTFLDEPEKRFDNGPDMLRYYYINRFPLTGGGRFTDTKSNDAPMMSGVRDMEF